MTSHFEHTLLPITARPAGTRLRNVPGQSRPEVPDPAAA